MNGQTKNEKMDEKLWKNYMAFLEKECSEEERQISLFLKEKD